MRIINYDPGKCPTKIQKNRESAGVSFLNTSKLLTLLAGEASIQVCIAAWKVICINTRADSSMNLKTNPHEFKLNKKTLSFLQNSKKLVILSTHFCSSKLFIVKPFFVGVGVIIMFKVQV